MTPNTSQFTDQQSRNVSLCIRGGKGKHIKLFDITFRRTGWWIAFFPLHLSLFSSSAFSPKRFLIFLSDRLWRNAFLTERDKHWCLLCGPPAASVYFCFSWVAPSCFLLCIVHMTNAIRPILMVYNFTPLPLDVYVYECINTVLFVPPQLCFYLPCICVCSHECLHTFLPNESKRNLFENHCSIHRGRWLHVVWVNPHVPPS